jgi:hypothetical protein
MYKVFLFISLLLSNLCFGQWNQMGSTIQGEAEYDNFGWSTAINSTGDVLVVGGWGNDGNGDYAGHTQVFAWDGTNWIQRGGDIEGTSAMEFSGRKVSVDASGNTIAITSLNTENQNGHDAGSVRVFDWDGINWVQRGQTILGLGHPLLDEWFGAGLSLCADGNTLIIGGPNIINPLFKQGYAQVYQWNGNEWTQLGNDIEGTEAYDELGMSVSINEMGNVVAVGAPGNVGNGINQAGYVKVYEWTGTDWTQRGTPLFGEFDGDEFGRSVTLNTSGDVLAIGAPGYDVGSNNLVCAAYVYEWNGTNWAQRGNTFLGVEFANAFGFSLSLNNSGNILAIGATHYGSTGKVQIFEYTGATWTQIGDLAGNELNDIFGCSVSLNGNGDAVAVGAWGGSQDHGYVSVFQNPSLVGTNELLSDDSQIYFYPNPASNFVLISGDADVHKIRLLSLDGKEVMSFNPDGKNKIDLTNIKSGIYVLEFLTNSSLECSKIIVQR